MFARLKGCFWINALVREVTVPSVTKQLCLKGETLLSFADILNISPSVSSSVSLHPPVSPFIPADGHLLRPTGRGGGKNLKPIIWHKQGAHTATWIEPGHRDYRKEERISAVKRCIYLVLHQQNEPRHHNVDCVAQAWVLEQFGNLTSKETRKDQS